MAHIVRIGQHYEFALSCTHSEKAPDCAESDAQPLVAMSGPRPPLNSNVERQLLPLLTVRNGHEAAVCLKQFERLLWPMNGPMRHSDERQVSDHLPAVQSGQLCGV
jgi:hypothetical protein